MLTNEEQFQLLFTKWRAKRCLEKSWFKTQISQDGVKYGVAKGYSWMLWKHSPLFIVRTLSASAARPRSPLAWGSGPSAPRCHWSRSMPPPPLSYKTIHNWHLANVGCLSVTNLLAPKWIHRMRTYECLCVSVFPTRFGFESLTKVCVKFWTFDYIF